LDSNLIQVLKHDYNKEFDKNNKYEFVRRYFDYSKKEEYTIDDETWTDLDMDRIHGKLDRSYSSLGESVLYYLLRNPIMEEEKLKNRDSSIKTFMEDSKLREKLQCIFYRLGKNTKNTFLEMMEKDIVVDKTKYYIYTFMGKIIPLIIILLSIFIVPQYLALFIPLSFINMIISYNESKEIKANGIYYLAGIIKAGKKLVGVKDDNFQKEREELKAVINKIKPVERGTYFISIINMWKGAFEAVFFIFLIEETAYYLISNLLLKEKDSVMELYFIIGKVEALISIAGYKHNLKTVISKPSFVEGLNLNIKNGIHPILKEPVPNSINIHNKGIVLTGTNMAGKSTFLRMVGVNILLAQCFYFTQAESYEASFLNIVSSISPKDDIESGKSYYMAEAEGILRIIKAMSRKVPVFCPIDEIFRGTNPIERISASAEILSYLNKGKTISIVATHDRELVDILKDSYDFYYFSEKIDKKKGLSFDYKIKEGISSTRNAIRLLEQIGYPKEIIDKAFKRAESIDGFI